jgi:hypothetical protein
MSTIKVGLDGNHSLSATTVDAKVTKKSAGAYALGDSLDADGAMPVKYVGRADNSGAIRRWLSELSRRRLSGAKNSETGTVPVGRSERSGPCPPHCRAMPRRAAMSTSGQAPIGLTRSNFEVVRRNSSRKIPEPATATQFFGSTLNSFIAERSIIIPPSVVDSPATLWPPLRTATSRSFLRAKSMHRTISSLPAQRAIFAGCLS